MCDDVRSSLHVPRDGRFANRPYIMRARNTRFSWLFWLGSGEAGEVIGVKEVGGGGKASRFGAVEEEFEDGGLIGMCAVSGFGVDLEGA